ncbi:hypothetical protein LCGC14_1221580, partial [marine sediment metagenome]
SREIIDTIWGDAPEVEKYKAGMICKDFGLNPLMNHVYLIPFKRWEDGKVVGIDWATVIGRGAKRLMASRRGPYSYIENTPRVMTEEEQMATFGEYDEDKLYCITKLQDPQTGVTAVGVEDYAMEIRIAHGNGSLLTVSGTTGNLIIDIDTVDYSEAFSTDVEETIDNWLATHTATLAGLGIPIIATKESASAIRLVTTDSIVFTDNSTGDMAFVVAGQMKIYGCLVENLLVNSTPGEASFDIVRIFENNSGALITVSEVGMYYSPDLAPYTEQYCISRHVLAAPIIVANGEFLKLTHTIKVVL